MAGPITIGRRKTDPARLRLRWRRSINRLTPDQLAKLRSAWAALYELDDDRGYAHFAGWHGLPLPLECPHDGELFLPWHRAYLYFFELALREVDPTVTLPWWSWAQGRLPDAHTDPDPGNPLASAPIPPAARIEGGPDRTFREGPQPGDLPTQAEIDDALSRDDFLDFSGAVEQLHNRTHGVIGGSMGTIGNSAFDPIFWVHHAFVDRLWRLWQLRHSSVALAPSLLGQALAPFPLTVQQTLSVTGLGYDYARSSVSIAFDPTEDSGGPASFVERFAPSATLDLADAGIDRDVRESAGAPAAAGRERALRRADLVFYGVAHSRGTLEARVFFENPEADADTPKDLDHGYAGSFWVFGHDHCYGGPGHCDPGWGAAEDAIDYRRAHHMEPYTQSVTVTEALRSMPGLGERIGLTVVAVRAKGTVADDRPPLRFDHVRLLTYG